MIAGIRRQVEKRTKLYHITKELDLVPWIKTINRQVIKRLGGYRLLQNGWAPTNHDRQMNFIQGSRLSFVVPVI